MQAKDYEKIGKYFRKLRQDKDISQLKVCLNSDLSLDTVRIIEGGKRKDLKLETLSKLSKAFDVKLWQVFKELDI